MGNDSVNDANYYEIMHLDSLNDLLHDELLPPKITTNNIDDLIDQALDDKNMDMFKVLSNIRNTLS